MLSQMISQNEHKAIEAELVNASFQNANDLNLAGALIFSLLVYVVHDEAPWWIWLPGLVFLYLITLLRAIRDPAIPPHAGISRFQTMDTGTSGLLADWPGVCWGVANTAMLMYLPAHVAALCADSLHRGGCNDRI